VEQQIREVLSHRKKKKIIDGNLKASAVLVPVLFGDGQYCVLFTERSDEVVFHKGQVCFPGGTQELSDPTLLQTALRESEEEIGLGTEDVEILGELDDILTLTSNYIISPFVGFVSRHQSLRTHGREVKGTFCVPLSFLMDEANFKEESYSYEYEGHTIWGATARILRQFTALLKDKRGGVE
jgi:8-oxo-dGTP pyrophosphatase MutT (NUDIX family)